DYELVLKRLGGEQPIEWISVMERQVRYADNMPELPRQTGVPSTHRRNACVSSSSFTRYSYRNRMGRRRNPEQSRLVPSLIPAYGACGHGRAPALPAACERISSTTATGSTALQQLNRSMWNTGRTVARSTRRPTHRTISAT